MRLVMTIAALGLAAPMLSGCYALERALFGPGYYGGSHYRNHGYRDNDRYRDVDRRRSDRKRGDGRGRRHRD